MLVATNPGPILPILNRLESARATDRQSNASLFDNSLSKFELGIAGSDIVDVVTARLSYRGTIRVYLAVSRFIVCDAVDESMCGVA